MNESVRAAIAAQKKFALDDVVEARGTVARCEERLAAAQRSLAEAEAQLAAWNEEFPDVATALY